MVKDPNSRSEFIEQEVVGNTSRFVISAALFVGALLCFWASGLVSRGKFPDGSVQVLYVRPLFIMFGSLGMVGTFYYMYKSLSSVKDVKSRPTVSVPCPYCSFEMDFLENPTDGYDCESCNRRVHYEDGKPVDIRTITCAFCKTVHKVSVITTQYLCDRCNRALRLKDPKDPTSVVVEQSDALINYDVLLTDPGRRKDEVALHLQNLLVCNLLDARRAMEDLPLTISRNVPERKADSIRRKMRELGATSVTRPTQQSEAPKK